MAEFVWRRHEYAIPASLVGQRVVQLESEYGVCHPERLVEDARPSTSPLHDMFEWDNTRAAERYRVEQARGILQSIRVILEPDAKPVPAFVHVRLLESGNGYVGVARAMSDQDMRAQVLGDALRQLDALQHRYDTLAELRPVWRAVSRARRRQATRGRQGPAEAARAGQAQQGRSGMAGGALVRSGRARQA